MALLSRFPVDSSRTDAAGTASLPVLSAELETPVGRLCVIGVHPNAPFGSEESINRNLYLYQVGAMAQTRGMMCLLAGDFNAAPWSSGFEIIRNLPNLQPSIWRVPASWPASFGPLGVPLDHILLTMPFDKVRPIRMSKIWSGPHLPGSDHRPLITTLEVK